jgi:hypothetical protein
MTRLIWSIRCSALAFALSMMGSVSIAQDPTVPSLAEGNKPVDPIQHLEPASYMGISTSIASRSLREQSKVPRGVGVVVDFVETGSPADKAGIKIGDVIHKMDDQFIINAQQFTVLVRMRQPGDVIKVALVRGGEPALAEVTVTSRDLPPMDEPVGLIIPPELRNGPPMPRAGTGRFTGVMTHTDAEHTITITAGDTTRRVRVVDRAGAVVYEGGLNTDEERRKIPDAIRSKVDRIEKGSERVRDLRRTETTAIDPGGPVE